MSTLPIRLVTVVVLMITSALRAELPAEAQAAMDRGVIAAKQQEYPLALRFFEDARKLAPESPELHFNLGLTESKIPGRELRAMAWFGAYLAANPLTSNAVAIKEQIKSLDVSSQSSISRLLKTTRDTADQTLGTYRVERLLTVVRLWLDFGDISEAQKTANLMIHSIKDRDERVFNAPTSEGLSVRDQEKRHVDGWRDFALRDIAFTQTSKGDIRSALKTVELMKYSSTKSLVLQDIANAENMAGNFSGAKKTLLSALKIADGIDQEPGMGIQSTDYVKSNSQSGIAETQIIIGDIAGAQKTVDVIKHAGPKCFAQIAIARAQIMTGDIAGAQKTLSAAQRNADLIEYASHKSIAEMGIAEVKAKADNPNAPDLARQSTPASKPPITASDWLKMLDDDSKDSNCPLNTEPFLDLAQYLKSLPSDDADLIYHGLYDATKNFVSAHSAIQEMLKQQAKL